MPDKLLKVALAALCLAAPLFADVTVIVQNNQFTPATVNIAPGETVTWQFNEPFHTTTSDATSGAEVWDSGMVAANGTFAHTFGAPGAHPYYCAIHSFPGGTNMNGVVNVVQPAPTLASVSPATGSTAGGTTVTLTGTNFAAGCTVDFGGVAATAVTFNSSTSIDAVTPAHAAGVVAVTVDCSGQSATLPNAFTFLDAAPVITSVSPSSAAPGVSVTISGSGFQSGATVTIGGVAAAVVQFVDDTTIIVQVPSLPAGPAAVTVINPDQQSASFGGFSVLAPEQVPLGASFLLTLLGAIALLAAWRLR